MPHKRGLMWDGGSASAAELSQDLVEADAGPDRDRFGRSPVAGAARRDHGARTDQALEVGCIGIQGSELRDRPSTDGHHGALSGLGAADRVGEAGSEFSDPCRS